MFVDSHCHLNLIDYDALQSDMKTVVEAAKNNQIEHMLCVGTTLLDVPHLLSIANEFDNVTISIGLHPNEETLNEPSIETLIATASHPKVWAIGETGLDYYRQDENDSKNAQKERFIKHIEAAKALKKPLIIHTRQARADTIDVLRRENAQAAGGVLHCFTEDLLTAKAALDLGFYISFSGIVTFKNAIELQAVADFIPLDRMLIETDSPYLAPVPNRGKINQPAYVKHVAEFLANLRKIPVEELARQTTENFYKMTNQKQDAKTIL